MYHGSWRLSIASGRAVSMAENMPSANNCQYTPRTAVVSVFASPTNKTPRGSFRLKDDVFLQNRSALSLVSARSETVEMERAIVEDDSETNRYPRNNNSGFQRRFSRVTSDIGFLGAFFCSRVRAWRRDKYQSEMPLKYSRLLQTVASYSSCSSDYNESKRSRLEIYFTQKERFPWI